MVNFKGKFFIYIERIKKKQHNRKFYCTLLVARWATKNVLISLFSKVMVANGRTPIEALQKVSLAAKKEKLYDIACIRLHAKYQPFPLSSRKRYWFLRYHRKLFNNEPKDNEYLAHYYVLPNIAKE